MNHRPTLPALEALFAPLHPIERLQQLYYYFTPEEILVTSSFGTQSALLLYWISNIAPQQKIHFLDTGYHFEATLTYKKQLTTAFDLKVVDLHPDAVQHQQTRDKESWKKNTEHCCQVNKVAPMDAVKVGYNVWISGLMGYQTPARKQLHLLEQKDTLVKFYPLLDLSKVAFEAAYKQATLPPHPLQLLGYQSIGCEHCTSKGKGRAGRWTGQQKTECGLHFGR